MQVDGFALPCEATSHAFAALKADRTVVAWGNPAFGGDCSSVAERLKKVIQIQASSFAFAALLEDGNVINWGGSDTWNGNGTVGDGTQQSKKRCRQEGDD